MLNPTPPELILWDVVEEHLEQAVSQLGRWRAGLRSHRWSLDQVRDGLEERLEAHLAGLVVAGPAAAERLLYPDLEERTTPARATLAVLALLASGSRALWYELLDFLAFADDAAHRRDLVAALALRDAARFEVVLREAFARARSPREKAALLEAFAALHLDPGDGLDDCFGTGFDLLEQAALAAVGAAGRGELAAHVERHLEAGAPPALSTLEAGLSLGVPAALARCHELALGRDAAAARALLLLALLGDAAGLEVIHARLDDPAMRTAALWAMGFAGRGASVDRAIRHLEDDDARCRALAAEAIAAITGFDRPAADRFLAAPGEPPPAPRRGGEAGFGPEGTDDLPALDPYALCDWWEANRRRFDPGERYLAGARHTPRGLVRELRTAPTRRRHGLALELALRSGGRHVVTADAFTARQLRQLRALERLEDGELVTRRDTV